MPKFIIERELPGLGHLTPVQWQAAAKKFGHALFESEPEIQWIESYVTADKLYCVLVAADEAVVRRHARRGGLPAHQVAVVQATIDSAASDRTPRTAAIINRL